MSTPAGQNNRKTSRRSRRLPWVALLLLLLLIALFMRLCSGRDPEIPTGAPRDSVAVTATDSGAVDDTVAAGDSLTADSSAVRADSAEHPPEGDEKRVSRPPRETQRESTRQKTDVAPADSSHADSLETVAADTAGAQKPPPLDPCEADTTAPWIYPEPSGGLHREPVDILFMASEPTTVEWRFEDEEQWRVWKGEPVTINSTLTLHYRACDSCGNCMEPRTKFYEIKPRRQTRQCPEGMEYISIGQTRFCIDKYEWPNRRDTRPTAFVSIYAAMDSCFTAGKRLCTSEEWSLACAGAYGWRYPYGDRYESEICVTQDTAAIRAGERSECRGYFEVYDMAGNLAEWTSTRSSKNDRFYNVMGGFWESGPQSTCFDKRYSYFPQNRHNPVGFRCCSEPLEQ